MVKVTNHKGTRDIWRWKSGSAAPYRNWRENDNGEGRCTVLLEEEDGNKWQKADCNERHMFWCDDRNVPKPGQGFKSSAGKASVR